jgi:hypothetical protein
MGVNSDDGFKVTVAPGQPSIGGLVLGQFNDGRGASDTLFSFVVEEDGFYPFRLLWFEGNGGANCEWFSVDGAGNKTLINGTEANSIKAFRTGTGRAVLKTALPADGWLGGRQPKGVKAELVDGTTTVVDGSVKLFVGGKDVTAQANIVNGATTTVTYDPANAPDWGWPDPNWRLEWTESTTPETVHVENFTFRLAPDDLRYGTPFNIEAEDWNYQNGQTVASASTMPYQGGAYDGLAGTLNVDYFDDQNEDDPAISYTYRTDQRPNHADVTAQLTARFGTDRPGASSTTDMLTNYRLGWMGNFWGDYTRNIPQGVYKAYALLSVDNSNADGVNANLDRVTAGVGTQNQTLERLGTFYGRGNGNWGASELAPLRDSSGREGVFNVDSATTTLRITVPSGDFDGIILVPASGVPARLRTGPPTGAAPFSVPQTLTWILDDFGTTVQENTATLTIDGAAVTAPAFTVSKSGKVTTAKYSLPDIGVEHDYVFSVNDSAGAAIQSAGTLIGNFKTPSPAGMFLVEAEDFNTGGGQVQAAANTMPYLGNAYNGLSATQGVDYERSFNEGSGDVYRLTENPNVPFSVDGDTVRATDAGGAATWTLTANYRTGWAGGDTNWYNYTRMVPAGNYTVWASLSHGDAVSTATRMHGVLSVVTSDPTQPNPTLQNVGYFHAPATGGWGANQLIPLRLSDTAITGDAAVVTLGGANPTTFNYVMANGDYDYFMLVPSNAQARPNITGITVAANGDITIQWTGGGALEAAPAVTGPWTEVTGASSPYTFTPQAGQNALFGRIRAP